MNDPACALVHNPAHVCSDKFGQTWHRPNLGPRPGTNCHLVSAVSAAVDQFMAELESPQVAALLDSDAWPIEEEA